MESRQRHCPHLGLKHTRAIRFSSPTPEHRCYIFGEPLAIQVDQRAFCLGERYPECPRFAGLEPPPAAAVARSAGVVRPPRALRPTRQPSGLVRFWQQLERRERALYISLAALLALLLIITAVVYSVLVPKWGRGGGGTVSPTAMPSAVPTPAPTLPTVPAVWPTTVPPTLPVLVTATPAPTRTPSPTNTPGPTATSPATRAPTPRPATSAPPPTAAPTAIPPTETPVPEWMWSTLYFLGPNKAYYVPVSRQSHYATGVARQAIELMIEGPRAGSNLLRSIPQGMQLVDIRRDGDTLFVDLNRRFDELGAGQTEALAVVLAMTEFWGVDKTQFLVNGNPVGLPGSADTGPIWRPSYVNFENPYNLDPEEAVALTLYFATPDGKFLFPMVRRVPTTVTTARATIDEMIKGPSGAMKGLAISPLPADTKILDIYRDGSTIYVNFNSAFLQAPNHDLAVNALRFAMAGLTSDRSQGVDSVRISVEGAGLETYWGDTYAGNLYPPILNPEW